MSTPSTEPLAAFVAAVPAAASPVLAAVVSRFGPGPVHAAIGSPNGWGWVGLVCQPEFAAVCDGSPGAVLRTTGAVVDCAGCLTAL